MAYSSLAFRNIQGNIEKKESIIALHGNHGDGADLLPLTEAISEGRRIEAPTAARGIYDFRTRVSSSWYGGMDPSKPDPASFGDSLAQIEMFIHDAHQRAGADAPKPWLLGYEQGAVLALTISLIAPDLISGVMGIDGGLPQFSDPSLLPPVQADLPILLIGDSSRKESGPSLEKTAATLKDLGRKVDVTIYTDAGTFPDEVNVALRSWLQQQSSN